MSYIRSTSNPEKLYIVGSVDGILCIYYDFGCISCKTKDFKALIRKIMKEYGCIEEEKIHYKDLSVQEVHIFDDNNEEVPKECVGILSFNRESNFKICLSVGDKKVFMYYVTWRYIYENFKWEIEHERKQRKQRKRNAKKGVRRTSKKRNKVT